MSPRWIDDGQESFPAVDRARLERLRPPAALPERKRRELCELHGIALWQCMLRGPREQFECQWGAAPPTP
ncbi:MULTISPECIES: hypothetical protein [unclassified Streptomyces]|uniref:hypothetical protein n=1 Tax=unclassified Streptomyces TaxID=2593676 RepID=UPI001C6E63EF|nr:hypothetical protein [Streptomyces sp. MBT84]